MKYLFLILVSFFFFFGCGNMQVINEEYTSKTPGYKKSYSETAHTCAEAVKKSLKDLGTSVAETKGDRIISERWKFLDYAQATGGSNYATAVNYSISAKLYIDVRQIEKNKCEVQVAKVRSWENMREYEKLEASQVLNVLVYPFFKNVDESIAH